MKAINTAVIVGALLVPGANAQPLKDARQTLKAGNWAVLRSTNPMTDKVTCTGVYQDNFGVQLSAESLYITVAGGIKGITLRFGDQPADDLRLPTEMEKKVGVIIVRDTNLQRALNSSRLRAQTVTLVRGMAYEDLNLAGMKAAHEHIVAGCPVGGTPTAAQSSSQESERRPESLCSEVLLKRLQAAGVPQPQIDAACKP